jgi:hypothetical protein
MVYDRLGAGMYNEADLGTPERVRKQVAQQIAGELLPHCGYDDSLSTRFKKLVYLRTIVHHVIGVHIGLILPDDRDFEGFDHVTRLNAPLTAPWIWNDDRSWVANVSGRLVSGLDPAQFKFSQAGWDADGWEQSQAQADAGLVPKPFVRYTVLGVGNNPGIHIIAFGGILMGLGIPWAFYIKPWLVQREKKKIQAQLKAGTYKKPVREGAVPTTIEAGVSR